MNRSLQTRLTARFVVACAAGALCWPQLAMSASWKKVFSEEVSFEEQTTALSARERDKLYEKVREVQSSGGCIEYALVTGHANEAKEGDSSRSLALTRAAYVATLIKGTGVQPSLVHASIPPAVLSGCTGSSGACAEIEIQTVRRGAPSCTSPATLRP